MPREIEEHYKRLFFKVFKKRDTYAIRGMFDESYTICNELYSRNTFLNDTEIGIKDIRADILRAAVAKTAKLYCKKGILPFDFTTPPNSIGNCRHVELRFGDKSLYLARVDYPSCIPKKVQYRPCVPSLQMNLFYDFQHDKEESIDVFLATYGDSGANKFKFGNIGILGEVSWLFAYPLQQKMYRYITRTEKDELLVELDDSIIREDEDNAGGGE